MAYLSDDDLRKKLKEIQAYLYASGKSENYPKIFAIEEVLKRWR